MVISDDNYDGGGDDCDDYTTYIHDHDHDKDCDNENRDDCDDNDH